MKLKTISASSLLTFEECPSRFEAENVNFTPRAGGDGPAKLGTVVHDALKDYVQIVYVDKVREESLPLLLRMFSAHFNTVFNTADQTSDFYRDGTDMCTRWFERTYFDETTEILYLEEKFSIDINTKNGPIPYNFIWDRCDKITKDGKVIIRVVDYKTIREPLSPEQLHQKLQARMYAFAAAVKFKGIKVDEIWVAFDLLRYDVVETSFSRDDNLATWNYIRDTANKIIDEPSPGRETLGSGCQFCVRNTTCKTLRKNQYGGGVMGLIGNREALAEAQYELSSQMKGIKAALAQVEAMMVNDGMELEQTEYDTEDWHVVFKSRKTRRYDPVTVRAIVGDDIYATLGSVSVTEVDKLLKGDELDAIQKSRLRSSVSEGISDPKPTVTKRMIK